MDIETLKKSDVRKLFPQRKEDSHKGMNGRVLIVGGSLDFFGAPLLAAAGAMGVGADLVYVMVPECNFDVSRRVPDFVVRKYEGNYLSPVAVPGIVHMAMGSDCLLIGPGLTEREETLQAVEQIIEQVQIPLVLDACAMQVLKHMKKLPLVQPVVITPHMNEFEKLVGNDVRESADPMQRMRVYLQTLSKDLHLNIVLKGKTDYVTSDEGVTMMNETGNAGMTVGGTGDVLSGLIASFLAQGVAAFDAAKLAVFVNGQAGDRLFKQKGFGFTASDVAGEIAYAMKDIGV